MYNIDKPVIGSNYKVTGDTIVIPILEYKDEKIQWACSTSISTDAGKLDTLKEAITRPNVHIWRMSTISEGNFFLSRKAWITIKRIKVKPKVRNPVLVKSVLNIKE